MEAVGAFGWEEAVEEVADAVNEAVDGARGFLPQQRLELGEGHLDRIHVGAVGRQVEDLGSAGGDGLAHAGNLVGRQVIEHDDVAVLEGRGENVADINLEGITIHRPSSTHGAVMPDKRRPAMNVFVFPMPDDVTP